MAADALRILNQLLERFLFHRFAEMIIDAQRHPPERRGPHLGISMDNLGSSVMAGDRDPSAILIIGLTILCHDPSKTTWL